MTKQVKKTIKKTSKPLVPEKYQDLFFIVLLAVLLFVFFIGPITGGGFNTQDNVASISFRPYIDEATKSGEFPLWNPYIFSGLPGYAALLTSGERLWDVAPLVFFSFTEFIGNVLSSDTARVLSFYIIYAIGMYLLMRFKKHDKFVAFLTAFAAAFSTSVIVWIMIGHNTKPIVFAMFPFVLLFLEKLRVKFSILYTVLLIFALHIMNEGGHIQMLFYGICTFGLYLLFELVSRIISKKQPMKVVRAAGLLALAGGIAFMMSADRYLSVFEYTPYSTRGSAPLVKNDASKQDASGGNDYDYATMWSFSPGEIMTFFVPNYYGFGKLDFEANGQTMKLPTYWGQKPFEDAAPYMGIAVIALAIFGFGYYRKDVFVQFLLALSLFALILSFGYTLPILYDFFYYNVPSFNKFRAPSMALAMMQFAVPIMAGYGLTAVLKIGKEKLDKKNKKIIMLYVYGAGAFLILAFLFTTVFKSGYMSALEGSENGYFKNVSSQVADFNPFIFSSMSADFWFSAVILIISAIFIYLFAIGKLRKTLFLTGIFALFIIDLWRVGFRPMEYEEKKSLSVEEAEFRRTDVIDYLKSDNSVFRIADFSYNSPNAPAYFLLENVNGYHSAKLRVYQDMLDFVENKSTSMITSPFMWNLLNVKYMIFKGPIGDNLQPVFQSPSTGSYVYQNPTMLPRAYFVNRVEKASELEILGHLKAGDFNPREVAFVEESINQSITPPDPGASAEVTQKKNEYIKIEANATGANFLIVSEVYYPVSWKAYIDGKEVPIHKTNFLLRGIIVPNGKHIVELKFHSENFVFGKTLSTIANIVVFAALLAGFFIERKFKKKEKSDTVENG